MFGFFKKKHSQLDQVDIKENSNYSERQSVKHQKDKSDLIEYFHRGVDYSPKELQALNQFLDGVALKGYKFFHSLCGNMIMVQEVSGWQQKLALPINYDRHKQQMSVDKDYTDISYDCAMTYNVVQPLIEQFNKQVRGEKMEKDLNISRNSDKRLLLIKKLIQSHLDFYLYDNECDYKLGVKTVEELRECSRTLKEMKTLVDFAFNKIQEEEEEESITWSKLNNSIEKQLQELDELDRQLRDMTAKEPQENNTQMVYVPIYDNGEPYEDNVTFPENVCFKDFEACAKWIEEQCEDGVHYQRCGIFGRWELKLDKVDEEKCFILYPNGYYTIHEMTLKGC